MPPTREQKNLWHMRQEQARGIAASIGLLSCESRLQPGDRVQTIATGITGEVVNLSEKRVFVRFSVDGQVFAGWYLASELLRI